MAGAQSTHLHIDTSVASMNRDDETTTTTTANDSTEKTSKPPSPLSEVYDPSQYPARFRPLIPPPNFGAVQGGEIFRSAFPQPRNLDFVHRLGVKTVLCLVATEPSEASVDFVRANGIRRVRIDIAPNKDDKVSSTLNSIFEAVLLLMDASNWPLYIHCNQGRHRTGCVIACLRRMQQWPMEAIIDEYKTYASPKARSGDIQLIRDIFQPEAMLQYVKQQAQLDHRPSLMQLLRSDLVEVDVDKLVNILSSMDGVVLPIKDSMKSNTSSKADSAIEMCPATQDGAAAAAASAFEISVEECGPLSPPIVDGTGVV